MTKEFSINQRFDILNNLTTMVIDNVTPSLIVSGEAGLGKTHSISESIKSKDLQEQDYIFFKGYSTARGLYNALYDNNGKLIIFDDCDSVLEDKIALNILKSALDSYEKRTITWMAKMNKNDAYPQQFDFTGRVIFISNKAKKSINSAILTRSLTVDLTMTPDDKIERMSAIIESILPEYTLEVKKKALDYLNTIKDEVDLNIRMLIMISKIIATYPDNWKDISEYMVTSQQI